VSVIKAEGKVKITWPAQTHVGLGGYFNIYHRISGGAFDYDDPINRNKILAWPDGRHPGAGFGPAGQRPAGMGVLSAPAGYGPAGYGPAGFGTFSYRYVTGLYDDGAHEFCVIAYDAAGNRITPAVATASVTIAAEPLPPTNLAVVSHDDATDTTVFSWTLTEDEQAA